MCTSGHTQMSRPRALLRHFVVWVWVLGTGSSGSVVLSSRPHVSRSAPTPTLSVSSSDLRPRDHPKMQLVPHSENFPLPHTPVGPPPPLAFPGPRPRPDLASGVSVPGPRPLTRFPLVLPYHLPRRTDSLGPETGRVPVTLRTLTYPTTPPVALERSGPPRRRHGSLHSSPTGPTDNTSRLFILSLHLVPQTEKRLDATRPPSSSLDRSDTYTFTTNLVWCHP